jgi:hypothetical protein
MTWGKRYARSNTDEHSAGVLLRYPAQRFDERVTGMY